MVSKIKIHQPIWLTRTYYTNNYVGRDSFNRVQAIMQDNLIFFFMYLNIDNNPPTGQFIPIGKFNLPRNLALDLPFTAPSTTTGVGMISIGYDGTVQIYKYITSAWQGWSRVFGVGVLSNID